MFMRQQHLAGSLLPSCLSAFCVPPVGALLDLAGGQGVAGGQGACGRHSGEEALTADLKDEDAVTFFFFKVCLYEYFKKSVEFEWTCDYGAFFKNATTAFCIKLVKFSLPPRSPGAIAMDGLSSAQGPFLQACSLRRFNKKWKSPAW